MHHRRVLEFGGKLHEKRLSEWRDARGVGHVKNEEGSAPSIEGREIGGLWLPPLCSLLHDLGQRPISDALVACFDWDRDSRHHSHIASSSSLGTELTITGSVEDVNPEVPHLPGVLG